MVPTFQFSMLQIFGKERKNTPSNSPRVKDFIPLFSRSSLSLKSCQGPSVLSCESQNCPWEPRLRPEPAPRPCSWWSVMLLEGQSHLLKQRKKVHPGRGRHSCLWVSLVRVQSHQAPSEKPPDDSLGFHWLCVGDNDIKCRQEWELSARESGYQG